MTVQVFIGAGGNMYHIRGIRMWTLSEVGGSWSSFEAGDMWMVVPLSICWRPCHANDIFLTTSTLSSYGHVQAVIAVRRGGLGPRGTRIIRVGSNKCQKGVTEGNSVTWRKRQPGCGKGWRQVAKHWGGPNDPVALRPSETWSFQTLAAVLVSNLVGIVVEQEVL